MIAKAAMQLHDLESPARLELAAERIRSDSGVLFGGTWFIAEAGELWCNAVAPGHHVSAPEAQALMADAAEHLRELREASRGLDSLADGSDIRFAVVEDYGQGVAPLYCVDRGQLLEGDAAWNVRRRQRRAANGAV